MISFYTISMGTPFILGINMLVMFTLLLVLFLGDGNHFLKHTEEFSIGNIEKLSNEINFKRLDIHKKNFDLVRPYKLIEDSNPIIVLGFGK